MPNHSATWSTELGMRVLTHSPFCSPRATSAFAMRLARASISP